MIASYAAPSLPRRPQQNAGAMSVMRQARMGPSFVVTPLRPTGRGSPHTHGPSGAVPADTADLRLKARPSRVLLADADVLMGDGLRRILEDEGFLVVGIARSADELERLVNELGPQLVISDVGLAGKAGDGLDVVLRLRATTAAIRVMVLSAVADIPRGVRLLSSGPGVGYLLRQRVTDVPRFVFDLRRVIAGGVVVEPALLEEFITTRYVEDLLRVLSPREREVLTLVAQGHSNAHIAERLFVTRDTVEKHIQNLFFKLGVPEDDRFHRRVIAVLAYLEATGAVATRSSGGHGAMSGDGID